MVLDKLKISVLLVVPVVSGAATGGAIYASTKGDIAALKDAHAETRARVEKVEPDVQQLKTDGAVMKENVQNTRDDVKEIKENVRALLDRGRR